MPLIRKPEETKKVFNKEELIEETIQKINSKYFYHFILKADPVWKEDWDLLIIRTVEHEVHEVIGKFHHESKRMRKFQQVFAVKFITPLPMEEEAPYRLKREEGVTDFPVAPFREKPYEWVSHFLIVDNVKSVLRALEMPW